MRRCDYIIFMRHLYAAAIIAACAAVPSHAEEAPSTGQSLIERGTQLFLEGLMKELEPALDGLADVGPGLRQFAEEMGPALQDLMAHVKDWSAYHPPEILPNGDIILRKRVPTAPQDTPEEGTIDL